MKLETKSKPHRLGIKRYDEMTYIITSMEEDQQFKNLLLGEIKPEDCRWTIQPAKLDWAAYRPKVMSSGGLTYIVTSEEELEHAIEGAWGGKDDANFRFTIPPYRRTASY